MSFERDPNEIGALWLKSNAKGDYMTGNVNGQPIVCFRVKTSSDKAPTWRILKAQPKESRTATQVPDEFADAF